VKKKITLLHIVTFALSFFVLLMTQCTNKSSSEQSTEHVAEIVESPFLNLHDSVSYVGMQECKTCHAAIFETFSHTGMGQSFGHATPTKSKSFGHANGYVYDSIQNLHYSAQWIDSILYITEFRLLNSDTIYKRTEKVDYIIGSGHHTNSHLILRNKQLFQAPITFYTQTNIWDFAPGFESFNTRFSRRIEAECITCHNAYPRSVKESFNAYESIPLGIDCERCHGPGSLHVSEMLKGNFGNKKGEMQPTIVNPARLPWNLQVDVCQRCHLQGNIVLKPGKDFNDFRPGMPLHHVFTVFMPEYTEGAEFKMAAHAERFQQSACFIQTNSKINDYDNKLQFTCISCHNPHVSVRETNTDKFNHTCQSCHGADKSQCSENQIVLKKNNFNCVSCHMPVSSSSDIPHVTVHDHLITTPQKRVSTNQTGVLIGLKSINETETDVLTLCNAYITYYEKFDQNPLYLQKAKALLHKLPEHTFALFSKIHFYYTANDFKPILKLIKHTPQNEFSDAWTCFRIAKAYQSVNDLTNALDFLNLACKIKSQYSPFLIERVYVLLEMKLFSKAESFLNNILDIDPKEATALGLLSKLSLEKNNIKAAVRYANIALSYNPDEANALFVLNQIKLNY